MTRHLTELTEHPVFSALDPADKDFMRRRDLSPRLNEFHNRGMLVSALIPFGIFPHIKTIPTVEMMTQDYFEDRYEGKHTIVVDSSGNTAHAVVRLAPAFGFKHVIAVMKNDVTDSKKGILDALSYVKTITLPTGIAECAIEEGARPGCIHLNQYSHLGNMRAHYLHTGPAIVSKMRGAELAVVAVAMGSGGTVGGVGQYLKKKYPHIKVVGVRPKLGEQVPGARDEKRMAEVVTLPWADYVDEVVEVSRRDAFIAMRRLWREVEPQPGPTSGLAYYGLTKYLRQQLALGTTFTGYRAAFICPDDGRFYSERTTGELDPEELP